MSISVVIYTPKNFYLLEKINEKISQFSASGLLLHWHIYDRKINPVDNSNEPKKLNMHHLEGMFQIWFFGCFVSTLVFAIEWSWINFKKFRTISRKRKLFLSKKKF